MNNLTERKTVGNKNIGALECMSCGNQKQNFSNKRLNAIILEEKTKGYMSNLLYQSLL